MPKDATLTGHYTAHDQTHVRDTATTRARVAVKVAIRSRYAFEQGSVLQSASSATTSSGSRFIVIARPEVRKIDADERG